MGNTVVKLALRQNITDKDLEEDLVNICENEHAECNSNCPIFKINGDKVPWVGNNCECFKDGKKMVEFLRKRSFK